jgi:hypothetical protein
MGEKMAACAYRIDFTSVIASLRQRLPEGYGFKTCTPKFIYLSAQAAPMNRAERWLPKTS